MIHGELITLSTQGFSDMHDITGRVQNIVATSNIQEGLVNIFNIGSTGSITTIEFEPALVADMQEALEKLWPHTMHSRHSETWGDDNGFSHLRASFLGPGLTAPVHHGEVLLGTWQQIVVLDHDNGGRQRKVFVQVVGE